MSKSNIKSVFGIVLDDDKVLFLKRSENTTRPGQWGLPGGGIKGGEKPEEACAREIAEETGLSVSVVRSVGVYSHSQYFLCYPQAKECDIHLANGECSDYVWSTPEKCMNIGQIMDLTRLLPLFDVLGMRVPKLPENLSPKYSR